MVLSTTSQRFNSSVDHSSSALFEPPDRNVITCDAEGCSRLAPTIQCSRCRLVYYCSEECQSKHSEEHKRFCRVLKKLPVNLECEKDHFCEDTIRDLEEANIKAATIKSFYCGVCMEDFKQDEKPHNAVVIPKCKHVFCKDCMTRFQLTCRQKNVAPTCPLCRTAAPDIPVTHWELAFLNMRKAGKEAFKSPKRLEYIQKAFQELDQISQDTPSVYLQSLITKIELHKMAGNYHQALRFIRKTYDLQKRAWESHDQYEAILRKVHKAVLDNDQDKARLLLYQANVWRRDHLKIHLCSFSLLDFFVLEAKVYEASSDFQKALDCYLYLDCIRRSDGTSLPKKGFFEKRSNCEISCLSDIAHVINSDRYYAFELVSALIRCYYHTGKYDQAIATGEEAIRSHRHIAGFYEFTAMAYNAKGNLEGAKRIMSQAVLYITPWDERNIYNAKVILQKIVDAIDSKERQRPCIAGQKTGTVLPVASRSSWKSFGWKISR